LAIVTPAVAASEIVNVIPSVLNAGGSGEVLNGMMITASPRIPTGQLLTFPNAAGVTSYFGTGSQESALATIYFNGFQNATQLPSELFFYGYDWLQPSSAFLRGGSIAGLTLAQLQALSGTLTVTIDGVQQSASISLSGATSFSNAAQAVGADLGIHGLNQGSYVGSISSSTLTVGTVTNGPQQASFIGSITGGTLTVTTLNSGNIGANQLLVGTGVTVGTTITANLSGVGGVGTYSVSPSGTAGSENITSYVNAGMIAIGDVVGGTGVTGTPYVSGFLTGTGGVGTYTLSTSQTTPNGTLLAYLPAVTYDAISGGLQVNSGTNGSGSTMTYATGALATSLNLTQATGAQLSQGAAQSTPAATMNAIIAITANWAQFMTLFEPVDTDKEAFSLWTNGQANIYAYAMWDTNVLNTEAGGPSPAWGTIVGNTYSGTSLIHENPAVDATGQIAAFVLGYGASVNYNAFQGRATAAFKQQSGLAPQVFSTTAYNYILQYGGSCYGDFTTANQAFTFYSPGSVTGPFQWLDSYLDSIWLRNQFQLAGMELLTQVNSIPYNTYGYGLVQNALEGVAQQGVFNGVIQPGIPLSEAQQAEVFALSGSTLIAPIIQTRGWYLQIQPAQPQVRQARTSPVILFFYTDGESIQQLDISAILIQ
jgi:hypothetical protein